MNIKLIAKASMMSRFNMLDTELDIRTKTVRQKTVQETVA